jgi:hypothetical protein
MGKTMIRGSGGALADYGAAHGEVARLVRSIMQFLKERKSDQQARCQELLVKLAEDRFDLAVVG